MTRRWCADWKRTDDFFFIVTFDIFFYFDTEMFFQEFIFLGMNMCKILIYICTLDCWHLLELERIHSRIKLSFTHSTILPT